MQVGGSPGFLTAFEEPQGNYIMKGDMYYQLTSPGNIPPYHRTHKKNKRLPSRLSRWNFTAEPVRLGSSSQSPSGVRSPLFIATGNRTLEVELVKLSILSMSF